jgi:hypothetical protein
MVRVEGYRWVILVCYIGVNGVISLGQNGFSAVTDKVAFACDVPEGLVLLCGIMYLILFLPSEIAGNFLYKHMKIHNVLKLAASVQIFGAVFRCIFLFTGNFIWVFIGNIFIASTNAIVQMATIELSNIWFPPE